MNNQAYRIIFWFNFTTFFKPECLCVTKVSEINLSSLNLMPETKSPEVIPVAQKIESPLIISFKSYFFERSLIPISLALFLSVAVSNKNLPWKLHSKASNAAAARTPSGPPPIPKKMSTEYFSSVTNSAPDTSPSDINLILTFKSFNSAIILSCLDLFKIQAVKFSGFLFKYSLKLKIFF